MNPKCDVMKSNTNTVARPLQPGFSSVTLNTRPISTKTFLNEKCVGHHLLELVNSSSLKTVISYRSSRHPPAPPHVYLLVFFRRRKICDREITQLSQKVTCSPNHCLRNYLTALVLLQYCSITLKPFPRLVWHTQFMNNI